MPTFVRRLRLLRSAHCVEDLFLLRMDVNRRGGEVTVTGQVCERVRVPRAMEPRRNYGRSDSDAPTYYPNPCAVESQRRTPLQATVDEQGTGAWLNADSLASARQSFCRLLSRKNGGLRN